MNKIKNNFSEKTRIADVQFKYWELVHAKSKNDFLKKHGFLMLGLDKCLEIFFGKKFQGHKRIKQEEYKVYEMINGKKKGQPFKCDYYAEIDGKHIVFEFNGPHHYQSPFKIFADKRKSLVLKDKTKNHLNVEHIIFKIPYYMQLTKDYAKYLFQDEASKKEKIGKSFYSDEKYTEALYSLYGTDDPNLIYAPGFHNTPMTPASFNGEGMQRFLKEMKEMSDKYPSIKHQVWNSLKLYHRDVNLHPIDGASKDQLILPLVDQAKQFYDFFNFIPEKQYLNCVFLRENLNL